MTQLHTELSQNKPRQGDPCPNKCQVSTITNYTKKFTVVHARSHCIHTHNLLNPLEAFAMRTVCLFKQDLIFHAPLIWLMAIQNYKKQKKERN